jgi:hypothetical protein
MTSFHSSSFSLSGLQIERTQEEPDYLDYEIKGRGLHERLFMNTGGSYLLGFGGGLVYGVIDGYKKAPSAKLKLQFNSILNHVSRNSSRFGNAMGVLALLYTFSEAAVKFTGIEDAIPQQYSEAIIPATAAFASGAIWKSSTNPRVALLTGTLGAGGIGAYYFTTVVGIAPRLGSYNYMFF